jgi:hypothetical protein
MPRPSTSLRTLLAEPRNNPRKQMARGTLGRPRACTASRGQTWPHLGTPVSRISMARSCHRLASSFRFMSRSKTEYFSAVSASAR